MKKILFLIFTVGLLFLEIKPAIAAGAITDPIDFGKIQFWPTKINSASDIIISILNWLLGLGGFLAVVAILYSGFLYITAGSDQTKAENAKKNLIWAITGVVIVLLALVIVNWISKNIK